MGFSETMTHAAAATLYTNVKSISAFKETPNYKKHMAQLLKTAGPEFINMSGLASKFDKEHVDSVNFEPADFYSFIGGEARATIKKRTYAIITVISYKETYRSLKEYAYKQKKDCEFNAIEIGNVKALYNTIEYNISTFIIFHNDFLKNVKIYSDYDKVMTLNIDNNIPSLRAEIIKLLPKLSTIYGSITVPIVKYVVAHLKANNTSTTVFNTFSKPKGLDFLPDPNKKHEFINDKISKYMYFTMKLFALNKIIK